MKRNLLFCMMCLLTLCGFVPKAQAQTAWDGTADISWYDATQTSFDIYTPEQLAGVAQLVNSGTSFNGMTLNLTAGLDDITVRNLAAPETGCLHGNILLRPVRFRMRKRHIYVLFMHSKKLLFSS